MYVHVLVFGCISTCLIYRDRKERLSSNTVEEFSSLNVASVRIELMEPELNRQCKCGNIDDLQCVKVNLMVSQ